MALLLRIVVNAAALWVAALLVPGIRLAEGTSANTVVTVLLVALVFGILNALVRPLFVVLGLPLIAVTLGLFLLVINAVMLLLTGWISGLLGLPFQVDGFLAALLGGIVVGVISWIAGTLLRTDR
ncbi:MAG: phage holin family protein [Mobilicoccus sp.]|nr:phage holin family protein [Mobilicoccus sp.]